jgi:hypothetical protein
MAKASARESIKQCRACQSDNHKLCTGRVRAERGFVLCSCAYKNHPDVLMQPIKRQYQTPSANPNDRLYCSDCRHNRHVRCTGQLKHDHEYWSCNCTIGEHPNRRKPAYTREMSLQDAECQIIACKMQIYRLRELIVRIPHDEQRNSSLKHFEMAYNAFDKLQDFMRSR